MSIWVQLENAKVGDTKPKETATPVRTRRSALVALATLASIKIIVQKTVQKNSGCNQPIVSAKASTAPGAIDRKGLLMQALEGDTEGVT